MRPMLKHHADALVVALAVTPRNENLDAHGKAHCQGGENEIIQACHHGGTQFVGAEVTEEGGIGEGNDSLRKVTQHDGVCDAPDFAVGYRGLYHRQNELELFYDKTFHFGFPTCRHFKIIDATCHLVKANCRQSMLPLAFLHKSSLIIVNLVISRSKTQPLEKQEISGWVGI